jgi:hypothetical protein
VTVQPEISSETSALEIAQRRIYVSFGRVLAAICQKSARGQSSKEAGIPTSQVEMDRNRVENIEVSTSAERPSTEELPA